MNDGARRRFGVCITVALAFCVLSGCGGAQARLDAHLERGKEYLREGNYAKGGVELRNVLQIDPRNVEARLLSGEIAERTGDFREAVKSYRAALDLDAGSVRARSALGRIMILAGAAPQALELVTPALEKSPDDPDLLTVRAAAHMAQGDIPSAVADADHAIKSAPGNEYAVALRASLYRQARELPRAIELVRAAIEANPKVVDLREVLASLYADSGDNAAAAALLRKVIELRPNELVRRTRLALLQVRTRDLDGAQRTLEEAVHALPDDDQAKLQVAEFIATQRSRADGESTLRRFIAADPGNADLQLGLGALLEHSGASAEARAVYEAVVAHGDGPKVLVARNRIASQLVAAGKLDEAQKSVDSVLERNPRDLDALTLRGNIALARGRPGAAITDLRAVMREQPDALIVRRTLARAHVANQEPALAEDVLREALRGVPNDVAIRTDLAQLLCQSKRNDACVSLLEETVRLAPADPVPRETLVRAYLANNDIEAARVAAQDLITLQPASARGFYLSGLVAEGQKRGADAQHAYERAVELEPKAIDAVTALVRLHLSRGDRAAALARVRALADADPANAASRNLVGEVLYLGKEYPAARVELEAAIKSAPAWWLPYRTLAETTIAAGDVAGGIAAYRRGMSATHDDPRLAMQLAALYERQMQFEPAIEVYEKQQARDPRNELVANNLAMLLVTYRKDRSSLDRARVLTEGFSGSETAALLDTHGWVRLRRGEIAAALPTLERAALRAPDSQVIRFHLGMAQLQAGQRDKARDNLEQALARPEKFAGMEEAKAALAGLKRRAG